MHYTTDIAHSSHMGEKFEGNGILDLMYTNIKKAMIQLGVLCCKIFPLNLVKKQVKLSLCLTN
jgi:hypothetical protein